MIAILIILGLIALLWLGLALSGGYRATFRDLLNAESEIVAPSGAEDLPAVTVIVPARNEAEMLPATIPSICRQEYPDVRVIVVDDQSEDSSPGVLEDLKLTHRNLTVIQGTDRPKGWYGKPWAVWTGVAQATTELVLFTDADCAMHPQAIRQAVRFMRANGLDMFSIFPQVTFGSMSERIGMAGLVTVLAMLYPTSRVNDPQSPMAIAAGGFLLVRRSAYDKAGGHAAVKNQMIEDVNLARLLKSTGARVQCRMTCDLVTTRMYDGFADTWEGLSKNAYAGIEYQAGKFWAGLVFGLLAVVLPPVYLVASLAAAIWHPSIKTRLALGLSALIVACMIVIHLRTVRHLRLPWWHCLLMPASAAFYCLIAAWSFYQHHFRGGNVWKGRRYAPAVSEP